VAAPSVIAVIPARYGSSRLPAKALADIGGSPMIVHVWRQASRIPSIDRVIVATDDERIASPIRQAGGDAMITAASHQSGTDRIAEVAGKARADIYLNVQGDVPFINPSDVGLLADTMRRDESIRMGTLAVPIRDIAEFRNPNVVKVVCDKDGFAMYFSRSPIPHSRDIEGVVPGALHHIGVYAYRRDFLIRFASMPPGKIEVLEKLEQLRALENGYRIRVVQASSAPLEVDTAEDLERARLHEGTFRKRGETRATSRD
jgi:3-deoxy-manno-octulosonate cytidylyltransferase (CMP-KDO synthetase)